MPADFELLAQRKGFKRYMSPALREAVAQRQAAVGAREARLSGSLQVGPCHPPSGSRFLMPRNFCI